MKHQRIITSVLTLALVALSSPVLAEEVNVGVSLRASTTPVRVRAEMQAELEARRASTTERLEDRKEDIDERRENLAERRASTTDRRMEVRNHIEQRKASSTERRVAMQMSLAKRKVSHVTKVILATIERLEKIIVRIESRIAKIQERGGNTAEAENFVVLTKENLADARIAVDVFANLDLSGSTAATNFETIRAAAAEAKEHIRAAHRNMMMAVRALKGPNTGIEREERATSTATSTLDSDD